MSVGIRHAAEEERGQEAVSKVKKNVILSLPGKHWQTGFTGKLYTTFKALMGDSTLYTYAKASATRGRGNDRSTFGTASFGND